jgi:Glycosyl transferase family 2
MLLAIICRGCHALRFFLFRVRANLGCSPVRHKIDPSTLTVVLTSCGRFDLLEETVTSFLNYFETDRIIVGEDGGAATEAQAFATKIPQVEMRVNTPRCGQMRSIDSLYASVPTPYILHLEDDWKFSGGLDLNKVVRFLDARSDISVVCIGYRFDTRFKRSAQRITSDGIDYWVWDLDSHPKWFSYSFNPSVARHPLWREIGPYASFKTEEGVSSFIKARGLRIAMTIPSLAEHIGEKRHAADPFQPKRAKTPIDKLKRSIAKRWERLNRHAR